MAALALDTEYTITDISSGVQVATVKVESSSMRTLVRWYEDTVWEEDPEALAMVLFPDDVGVRVRP